MVDSWDFYMCGCNSNDRFIQVHIRNRQDSSNVNGKELPIYCVQTDEKKVALSFDAAWGNDDTQRILDILKEHDVHVTFHDWRVGRKVILTM